MSVIGNIVDAGVGLLVHWIVHENVGSDIEQSVRTALGEQGCQGRTVPDQR